MVGSLLICWKNQGLHCILKLNSFVSFRRIVQPSTCFQEKQFLNIFLRYFTFHLVYCQWLLFLEVNDLGLFFYSFQETFRSIFHGGSWWFIIEEESYRSSFLQFKRHPHPIFSRSEIIIEAQQLQVLPCCVIAQKSNDAAYCVASWYGIVQFHSEAWARERVMGTQVPKCSPHQTVARTQFSYVQRSVNHPLRRSNQTQ